MTLILHLETSTKSCSVALSVDGELVGLVESHTDEFMHSENLTRFVEKVLKDDGFDFSQLSAVSVASGPGSYTGLRIGVSTAKGLCYALNIPLIAIDSLISLCIVAREKYPEGNICTMIDARRMEVFSSIYDQNNKVLKPISADILDEASYAAFEPFVCVGDGAQKMSGSWRDREIILNTEINPSAKGQIAIAFEKFKMKEFEDVAYFEPFYLKDFMIAKPGATKS
jgi:tRNA threonylcarbamoyladenosine biosynthesis protein TsaB